RNPRRADTPVGVSGASTAIVPSGLTTALATYTASTVSRSGTGTTRLSCTSTSNTMGTVDANSCVPTPLVRVICRDVPSTATSNVVGKPTPAGSSTTNVTVDLSLPSAEIKCLLAVI